RSSRHGLDGSGVASERPPPQSGPCPSPLSGLSADPGTRMRVGMGATGVEVASATRYHAATEVVMAGDPVLVGVDFTGDTLRVLMTDEHGHKVADGAWPLPELPDEEAWSWEVGGRIASLFADEGEHR